MRISTLYSLFRRYSRTSNCRVPTTPHDHFFHAASQFLEDLDSAFLGDLLHSFYKLFALHGIYLHDPVKMLRSEGRNASELEFAGTGAEGISYGEDTGIKYADDISRVGFVHDLSLLGHHLLGLGKLYLFSALHMVNFHALFKFAGTDSHESNTVPMGAVHVGLDFENEG